MVKQKIQNIMSKKAYQQRLGVVLILAFFGVGFFASPFAFADQFQRKINELQAQNNKSSDKKDDLEMQASSYEDAIHKLNAEIASLQDSIERSQAKQHKIENKIIVTEAELDKQRDLLGQNIKAMYLEGEISTLEMLASSKDLSEFVDKEQYRSSVEDKIKTTLDQINALKLKLKSQKEKVEALIASQQSQQEERNGKRAQQHRLLSMNQGEQNDLNKKIKKNAAKIAELQQQQIIANARLFGGNVPTGVPGGGGYKYGNARCIHPGAADPPCGQYDWGFPNAGSPRNIFDEWGYGYRNCTSYVAFKLNQVGKAGFTHLGNAKSWPSNVPSSWVSYGGGARAGDAAVSTGGAYGHVMYVHAVSGGKAYVSDYNFGGDGYYRGPRPVSQGSLVFIHFP